MYDNITYKKNKKISAILALIGIIVGIFVLIMTKENTGYEFYWIIPFLFSCMLFLRPVLNFTDFSNVGPLILSYTMVIKYIISPLLSCIAKYKSWLGIYPSVNNIEEAILLTLYEMIMIYFVCIVCTKKYSKILDREEAEIKPLNKKWVHLVLIAFGLISFVLFPDFFRDYRLIFNKENLEKNVIISQNGAGVFRTLYILSRYSLILIIIDFFYRRNLKKNSYVNLIGTLIPILLNCIHVPNLSRISILVPLIIGIALCTQFFSKKNEKRFVLTICLVPGIIFLCVLSYSKFFGEGRGNKSNANDIAWWADTINMYFTGIKETAIGCKGEEIINETYGYNRIRLLINDVFSNISLLSNFSEPMLGSVRLYNYAYFGKSVLSQIPPNVIEGKYYFSNIFAGFWPATFVALSYKFNFRAKKKSYIDEKFINLFPSIWCGLVLMINTTMIIANSVNIAFFYASTLFLNKILKIKKKE